MVASRAREHGGGADRDRDASRRRLIESVGAVLAEKGFQGVGVNAVARRAGLDKVLIYRYFGGLPGLISAFAVEYDFWPSIDELVGGDVGAFQALPVVDRLALGVRRLMRAIRSRPLTQEILTWVFKEQSETTEGLDAVRERVGREFLALSGLSDPAVASSIDVPALLAIVGAAVNHLCARADKLRYFAGIDLADDDGWKRIEDMLERMIKAVFTDAGADAGT